MLWLKFILFHESWEVGKDVSVNGRIGVRTVKRKHEDCRDEDRIKFRHLRQKCMGAGVLLEYFFCSGITRNVSFFCYYGGRQVMGNMCDILHFCLIISLARKKRARLCAIRPCCRPVPYFPFYPIDSHIEDCII